MRHAQSCTSGPDQRSGDIIDTDELSQRLGVCRRTIKTQRDNGSIPFIRLGRSVRFHWPTIEAALLRRQRGGE